MSTVMLVIYTYIVAVSLLMLHVLPILVLVRIWTSQMQKLDKTIGTILTFLAASAVIVAVSVWTGAIN